MVRIGFLGAGKMAQALVTGFLKSKLVKPKQIIASCIPEDKSSADAFRNLNVEITFSNAEVVQNADIIILAVKPNVVPAVLFDISQIITEQNLLISVAMGITLQTLERNLKPNSKVIRVMPNTPVLVQKGVSVFVPGSAVTNEDITVINKLLQSVGTSDQVSEELLDVVTALSGSGPAYMYIIIEALADGAVRMGMARHLAYRLAAQTMLGASEMVLSTGDHPGKLKDDVMSPGGSTAEGLTAMENGNVRAVMINTLERAFRKCKETKTQNK